MPEPISELHGANFTIAWLMITAYPLVLLAAMLVASRLGRRWRHHAQVAGGAGDAASGGSSSIHAAAFAMLGLLIAFTFAIAYGRLNTRRDLIIQEANAIGTLFQRCDLLPEGAAAKARSELQGYVDSRLAFWEHLRNGDRTQIEIERADAIQQRVWQLAIASPMEAPLRALLLPVINELGDLRTERTSVIRAHPPLALFAVLFLLAVACSWLAGTEAGPNVSRRHWHPVFFAGLVTVTVWLILDIEYPRVGFVTLDSDHDAFRDLLRSMRSV